jgi:hypothetical protein
MFPRLAALVPFARDIRTVGCRTGRGPVQPGRRPTDIKSGFRLVIARSVATKQSSWIATARFAHLAMTNSGGNADSMPVGQRPGRQGNNALAPAPARGGRRQRDPRHAAAPRYECSQFRTGSNQSRGNESSIMPGHDLARRIRRLPRARAIRLFTVPTLMPRAAAISS